MTVASVVAGGVQVVESFAVYVGIAVAIPLGIYLVGRIKHWVTSR